MLIILNGPPGVGKDTIGCLLSKSLDAPLLSFKTPLWDIAEALLGRDKFEMFCELYNDRTTKELPMDGLGGMSPRQFFIHISEKIAKPIFGEEYFGDRMKQAYAEHQMDYHTSSVVTDGGFPRELYPFLKEHVAVVVVRLYREGYDFGNDSRAYLEQGQFSFFPAHQRPVFLDVHLEEGQADSAAGYITGILRGK